MSNWISSPNASIKYMAQAMSLKYNKHQAAVNGLVGVTTILYSKFKMKLICFYYGKIYKEFCAVQCSYML